jgi:hypothetical protein
MKRIFSSLRQKWVRLMGIHPSWIVVVIVVQVVLKIAGRKLKVLLFE